MSKRTCCFIWTALLMSMSCWAQDDAGLRKYTADVLLLRSAGATEDMCQQTIGEWSSAANPKIVLMDDIGCDKVNEFLGHGANKFQINKVVASVYKIKNVGMSSKGEYFNSTEKDINYSAIEKNIRRGATVTYHLTAHVGPQEFVFISYHPKTSYIVLVNGVPATDVGNGVKTVRLSPVSQSDIITITITNTSSRDESFVILNHNPQK